MVNYSNVVQTVEHMNPGDGVPAKVISGLINLWLSDYDPSGLCRDIVQTTAARFSYLFDVGNRRLVSAWGISQGRNHEARDKSRMAGHPLSAGTSYHRGHAIPHTLGGPTDINLVPQLGSINVGPFRELEKKAVATRGALYFTYWKYGPGKSQIPIGVEQGLLIAGSISKVQPHQN